MIEDTFIPDGPMLPQQNAGSASEIEVRTLLSQRKDQLAKRDLAFVLDNPESRRVLMRILTMTGIHGLSSTDPVIGQRDEGARSVGLQLMTIIGTAGIEVFPKMLMEQAHQAELDRLEADTAISQRGEDQLGD